MLMPGYVCLAVTPGEEWYTGVVENSFSLGVSLARTQFFWSGKAYSNLGTTHVLDGWKSAKYRRDWFQKTYPGIPVFIFDARNVETLPVTLDWEQWLLDCRPAEGLSGVTNKFGARNILFQTDPSKPLVV